MSSRNAGFFPCPRLWAEQVVEMAMLFDRDELVSLLILSCVSVRVRAKAGAWCGGHLDSPATCNDGLFHA